MLSYNTTPPLNMERLTNWTRPFRSENEWHHMGLCYRSNCEKLMPEFKNCGIGACSLDSWEFGHEIINIVFGSLAGVKLFILTLGSSSALKLLPHNTASKVGGSVAKYVVEKSIPTSVSLAVTVVVQLKYL